MLISKKNEVNLRLTDVEPSVAAPNSMIFSPLKFPASNTCLHTKIKCGMERLDYTILSQVKYMSDFFPI